MNTWIFLHSRRLLSIQGNEASSFLHGLVTQNIFKPKPIFTAMLTPQGRFHSDFFVIQIEDELLIDCDILHLSAIKEWLQKFQALHDVEVSDISKNYAICVALGPQVHNLLGACDSAKTAAGEVFYADPRSTFMGIRALIPYERLPILPHTVLMPGTEKDYHYHRLQHVLPEGAYDLVSNQSVILEYGYDNAISWDKGCYVGQELMAQVFHRGEIRKRPYGLRGLNFPPKGTDLFFDQKKIGVMGSHCKDLGLASLYIQSMEPLSGEVVSLQYDKYKTISVSVFNKSN